MYNFTCIVVLETLAKFVVILKKTLIEEHIKNYGKSHIFKHLHSTTTCFDLYNSLSFQIIDKANSKLDLKTKESLHVSWEKSNLNAQQNHLAVTLCVTPFFLSVFFFFPFLLHLLSSFSLTVIIGIFTVLITSSHNNTPCKYIAQ